MEEYLDVLDEHGNKTGESRTYDEIHKLGLVHCAVHVWLLNSRGQVLLQKRSRNKKAYPNHWDISAAGHVSSGETSLETAQKETQEELGLELPDSAFTFLFSVRQPIVTHSETFIDNEFNDVYLVRSDAPISELNFPADEVEDIKWTYTTELKKMIEDKDEALVPHEEEYKKIFGYLRGGG